ncbi:MAG: sugar phosphate isomerase/epimerase [Clostridiales bacterium]|jgi:sugar phosphate isomerase/epimerase|nr:sugar phosphate isomerase/epimerase [Clostridiales bacterium]
MMETGISTACFFGKAFTEEAVDHIAKMGAPVCEIFLDTYSEYEQDFARMLRDRADAKGLAVRSVHAMSTQFEPQLFSINGRQQKDARELMEKVFSAARTLGAGIYVFHGPPAFRRTLRLLSDYERMGAIVSGLADMAAQYGLRFTWENVHWCAYGHERFAKRLLEHVKSENLYFTLDIKQAVMSGRKVAEYMEDMGPLIANVHLCDYRHTGDGRVLTCLPGAGELDMAWLRSGLERCGYGGAVILEVYSDNYRTFEELGESYAKVKEAFTAPV